MQDKTVFGWVLKSIFLPLQFAGDKQKFKKKCLTDWRPMGPTKFPVNSFDRSSLGTYPEWYLIHKL